MKKSVIIGIIVSVVLIIFIIFINFQKFEIFKSEEKSELSDVSGFGLGDLCSGEKNCKEFCLNNLRRCKDYCKERENELCKIIFFVEERNEQVPIVTEEVRDDDKKCQGTKTKFDFAPVNLDKTKLFLPLGLMIDSHVTPIDHHYFQNIDNEEYDIEIYSPGKGFITDIGHMPGAEEGKDYRINIEHTCTISSIYIYVSNLPEKINKAIKNKEYVGVRIPVEAGELLGYYKTNMDYNLVDEEIILKGFVVPEHYNELWKIHVPNTYDYFNEPVRSRLIEKSVRTAEPISGKIDYDIDGKLVGNWFKEGTNGYAGAVTEHGQEGYWLGHLSIVYDYIDPNRIVFSIGNYNGENSKQFSVKGNSPNPAEAGIEDGLIEYELVEYDYITPNGNSWDRKSLAKNMKTISNEAVQGVVLVQLIEKRKIKFEAFPGKTASQVNEFTENAKIYER